MSLAVLLNSPDQVFWGLMMLLTITLGILTLLGFFGQSWYWFDIFDQFRFQYLAILAVSILIFSFGRQPLWAFLSFGFLMINGLWVASIYKKPNGWKKGEADIRILLSNVLRINRSYDKFLDCVKWYRPDLILLVEIDQDWLTALASLQETYPSWSSEPRTNNYGLAILSRYPIESQQKYELTEKGNPVLKTDLIINNKALSVVVCHPPPPKNRRDLNFRNQEIDRLAAFPLTEDQHLILCGDFNISPWSMPFRILQRVSNLIDSTRGFGFQPSWPTNRFWMRVPIDHCLVTPNIKIINRQIGPDIGSDHFPVIVDLSLDNSKEEASWERQPYNG